MGRPQRRYPKDRLALAFLAKGEPDAADMEPFQGDAS